MQAHAVFALIPEARETAFAGQSNAIHSRARRRIVACIDEPIQLPRECGSAAETLRIEHLHEDRCAPAFGGVGATRAGQAAGQCLDEKRQCVALVPRIDTAER